MNLRRDHADQGGIKVSDTVPHTSARGMNRLVILVQAGVRKGFLSYDRGPGGLRGSQPRVARAQRLGRRTGPVTSLRTPLNLIVFRSD